MVSSFSQLCFDLLDALERLDGSAAGIEVRIVGDGEPSVVSELMRRADALASRGIAVRCDGTLTGTDKDAALAWAQVFVFPTRAPEGQPLSLLEAMSAGLPVISTDHPGISYTVRNGREGLIVPPEEPEALAGAIARLVDDVDLRRQLGIGARRRFEQDYRRESFDRAVSELLVPEPPAS